MIGFLLGMIVAATPPAPLPETAEEGRAYLERLYRDRAAITSGYLEYTVTTEVDARQKEAVGSVRTYRLWFDGDRRRLDIAEVRPRDPEHALSTRYATADGVHRIIDIDRANVCVREYTSKYLGGKEPPGVIALSGHLIDPRLLGVTGTEYGFLQYRSLDDLKTIAPEAEVRVRRVEDAGKAAAEISLHYPNGRVSSYVVSEGALLPVRMRTVSAKHNPQGEAMPEIRVEVESDVALWPGARGAQVAFPRSLKIRRITAGEVEIAETITVREARFNTPIDSANLTWQALSPARGAHLILNDDYQWDPEYSRATAWTGDRFAVVPTGATLPDPGFLGADRRATLRRAAFALLGIGALLVAGLAVLKLRGRDRTLA